MYRHTRLYSMDEYAGFLEVAYRLSEEGEFANGCTASG